MYQRRMKEENRTEMMGSETLERIWAAEGRTARKVDAHPSLGRHDGDSQECHPEWIPSAADQTF